MEADETAPLPVSAPGPTAPRTGARLRTPNGRGKQAAFLEALAEGLTISGAAKQAGVPRRTVYNWRDADPDFAKAWIEAEDAGADRLEDEALRRAVSGLVEPVYYGGKEVGEVRKYSDTLLVFLLKARRPDKYRDRVSTELSGPNGAALSLTDTEREARIQSLLAIAAQRVIEQAEKKEHDSEKKT